LDIKIPYPITLTHAIEIAKTPRFACLSDKKAIVKYEIIPVT
jgi:hypothetical protein